MFVFLLLVWVCLQAVLLDFGFYAPPTECTPANFWLDASEGELITYLEYWFAICCSVTQFSLFVCDFAALFWSDNNWERWPRLRRRCVAPTPLWWLWWNFCFLSIRILEYCGALLFWMFHLQYSDTWVWVCYHILICFWMKSAFLQQQFEAHVLLAVL